MKVNQYLTDNNILLIEEEFKKKCVDENLSDSTIRNKLTAFSSIIRSIRTLEPNKVHEWLELRSKKDKKPLNSHGKNRYIIQIKWYLKRTKLFDDAKEKIAQYRRYKVSRTSGKVLSEDEFESIIQYSESPIHRLALRLMYECGFRPHELISIRLSNISEEIITENGVEISVGVVNLPFENPNVPSKRNKTGGRQVIVIKTWNVLKKYIDALIRQGKDLNTYIFPWPHKHLSNYFCKLKKIFEKINLSSGKYKLNNLNENKSINTQEEIKDLCITNKTLKIDNESITPRMKYPTNKFRFRLYDLRHSAITKLYEEGYPDQYIKSQVGWTPASTMANTYVHIELTHKKRIIKMIQSRLTVGIQI